MGCQHKNIGAERLPTCSPCAHDFLWFHDTPQTYSNCLCVSNLQIVESYRTCTPICYQNLCSRGGALIPCSRFVLKWVCLKTYVCPKNARRVGACNCTHKHTHAHARALHRALCALLRQQAAPDILPGPWGLHILPVPLVFLQAGLQKTNRHVGRAASPRNASSPPNKVFISPCAEAFQVNLKDLHVRLLQLRS